MKWKLIKKAIYLVGAYKLFGYKMVRKFIIAYILGKGRKLLPI